MKEPWLPIGVEGLRASARIRASAFAMHLQGPAADTALGACEPRAVRRRPPRAA